MVQKPPPVGQWVLGAMVQSADDVQGLARSQRPVPTLQVRPSEVQSLAVVHDGSAWQTLTLSQ
jgi:hypothetical protein